jgi:beta-xylosidase
MQKFPAPAFTAATLLRFDPKADGDTAGLMVFGYDYAWLGLRKEGAHQRLVLVTCTDAQNGGVEKEAASADVKGGAVQLRVTVGEGARCRFEWSEDGKKFFQIGGEFQAKSSRWVGAKAGVFASAPPGAGDGGHADFDWFRVGSLEPVHAASADP